MPRSYAKTLRIEKLRATLALMKRARFGRSSERIEQLELLISNLEEEAATQQARRDAAGDRRPSKVGERCARRRQPLPAPLPRERVVLQPACACPTCGGTNLTRGPWRSEKEPSARGTRFVGGEDGDARRQPGARPPDAGALSLRALRTWVFGKRAAS